VAKAITMDSKITLEFRTGKIPLDLEVTLTILNALQLFTQLICMTSFMNVQYRIEQLSQ